MTARYNKHKRKILKLQEAFLEELVGVAGFKVCEDLNQRPDGASVHIRPSEYNHTLNWQLIASYRYPHYLNIRGESEEFRIKRISEEEAITAKMAEVVRAEGLTFDTLTLWHEGTAVRVSL